MGCEKRFTTYERVDQTARLMVIKRDGARVPFNSENILRGVVAACGKRKIPEEAKRRLVEEVEEELHRDFEREVPSQTIGERVMNKLRGLDEVAFVRFASEHLEFSDAAQIARQIEDLENWPREVREQQGLFTPPKEP